MPIDIITIKQQRINKRIANNISNTYLLSNTEHVLTINKQTVFSLHTILATPMNPRLLILNTSYIKGPIMEHSTPQTAYLKI